MSSRKPLTKADLADPSRMKYAPGEKPGDAANALGDPSSPLHRRAAELFRQLHDQRTRPARIVAAVKASARPHDHHATIDIAATPVLGLFGVEAPGGPARAGVRRVTINPQTTKIT